MYPINKHDGIYTFETKNGNKYRCSFTQSPDGLYGVEVKSEVIYFEFTLTHIVSKKYDKNIKLTIVDLLHRVFCNKPNVIIGFICSDTDNKAITRLQTFYRWFNNSEESKDKKFIKITHHNEVFAGIIFLKQNSEARIIETTIKEIKADIKNK